MAVSQSGIDGAGMHDRSEIEAFLYREARLLDERRYREWLSLWGEECVYAVPCGGEDADPKQQVSIIYDDKRRLTDRVERFLSGLAWASDPAPIVQRSVTNIEVDEDPAQRGNLVVRSVVVIGEMHQHIQNVWFGRVTHKLRASEKKVEQIVAKKIVLLNGAEPISSLRFIL
jgi:3-phenylpropionate/cinnamic acid dioxygenase small subunit